MGEEEGEEGRVKRERRIELMLVHAGEVACGVLSLHTLWTLSKTLFCCLTISKVLRKANSTKF